MHAALVGIARSRAGLDAEEARWIREAEQIQIWKQCGMVSMVDYLERICGHEPRSAQHRMRVARALGGLPQLNEALATGELCFSAVRELVRVAKPATEGAWREAARDRNLRQIEELVAGHAPGDLPDDPVEETARLHTLSFFEISASSFALFRQARQRLDEEHGSRLSDSDVIAAFANSVLDGNVGRGAPDPSSEGTAPASPGAPLTTDRCEAPAIDGVRGRAKNQISYGVCRVCDRGWRDAGGRRIPITVAELEKARCDAQHIGDVDADGPAKATQDIPPATVRFVWARDRGCCQTPGCRSSIGLEIHHILMRSKGGTHHASNLTLRCSSCHTAHHEGRLLIEGIAPDGITTTRISLPTVPTRVPSHARAIERPEPTPHAALQEGGAPGVISELPTSGAVPPLSTKYAVVARRTEAVSALRTMGWSPSVAKAAVDGAAAHLAPEDSIEVLLRAALRLCPGPRGSR